MSLVGTSKAAARPGVPAPTTTVAYKDVCETVLRAWERTYEGMNGLRFVSANFPPDEGFTIVQASVGSMFRQLSSLSEWAPDAVDNDVALTKRAYWAARVSNNCLSVNITLMNVLRHCKQGSIKHVRFGGTNIKLENLSMRTVGLTPHHVGTLVEPPFESKIPPSLDGETFHSFVVGVSESDGAPFALDCSCAQYGVFGPEGEPFIAMPLASFLRRLGKSHRLLKPHEQTGAEDHPMVTAKVTKCSELAIRELTSDA